MVNNLILLLCFILATIHYFIKRKKLTKAGIVDLYLVYFLFFGAGIVGLLGFVSHVFFAAETAKLIGWPAGSPFQFEVGFHDGAWGLLGILCVFFRGNFWLATGLGWSFFLLGATYGHIREAILFSNFEPYNVGSIASDLIIAVVLLTLLYLKYVHFKKRN